MRTVILTALLLSTPLLAQGLASAGRASDGVIVIAAAAPPTAIKTNKAITNIARSNVPAPTRSRARTKAGVLAAGVLIAITILIIACGLALLSSFKKR
jgi:hypothetical protein